MTMPRAVLIAVVAATLATAVSGCADTSLTDPGFDRRARPERLPGDSLVPTEFLINEAELRRGAIRRAAW
jgi:hypothetical protein